MVDIRSQSPAYANNRPTQCNGLECIQKSMYMCIIIDSDLISIHIYLT